MVRTFSLLDRYIISQLIPSLVFGIAICTILGELIGITFLLIGYVAEGDISVGLSISLHLLKLPAYLSVGFPFSVMLAALITCSDLSHKKEITALRASGISLLRIMLPILLLGTACSGIAFVFQEALVPPANHRAILMLEEAWGIDRAGTRRYNQRDIVYLRYDEQYEESLENRALSYSFIARRFYKQTMIDVTFLRYTDQNLSEIIVSNLAQWDEDAQVWEFLSGQKFTIGTDGSYENIQLFKTLSRRLTHDILEYAAHTRDYEEMNVFELRNRFNIIQDAEDAKTLRKLQMSIQERYAGPFSVLVFSYLGGCIGFQVSRAGKSSSFGIATLIIVGYYVVQSIAYYLIVTGAIPAIVGVWMPNAMGFSWGSHAIYQKYSGE